MKKCFLQVDNPLDDTLTSLLQGIKVRTQRASAGLYKLDLLDTHSHFSPRVYRMVAQGHGLPKREVTVL